MDWHVVIPARYASVRLPGKPLLEINGTPMIVHVARRAQQTSARTVVVATDDERILDALAGYDVEARLTRADHASGSERVFEIAQQMGWGDDALVVNVQGDEPLIPPKVIEQIAQALARRDAPPVVTLAEPMRRLQDVQDPNQVKVTFAADNRALYFSRAPIPWWRDEFSSGSDSLAQLPEALWWRHIGIYGYRVEALRRYLELPSSDFERLESLEQLRFLVNGIDVYVFPACAEVPIGVDTEEDLAAVRRLVAAIE